MNERQHNDVLEIKQPILTRIHYTGQLCLQNLIPDTVSNSSLIKQLTHSIFSQDSET